MYKREFKPEYCKNFEKQRQFFAALFVFYKKIILLQNIF